MSKNKKNLSVTEKVVNEKKFNDSANIADQVYNILSNVTDGFGKRLNEQLESVCTSVTLSTLRKFDGTKEDFLNRIDSENTAVSLRNKERIIRYFGFAFRRISVSETEKSLFLEHIEKVKKATDDFKYTFSEDETDNVGTTASGASYLKLTRFTVAGFRACINSYDTVFRTELTRLANIQKREKEQKRIKEEKTANIMQLVASGMSLQEALQKAL